MRSGELAKQAKVSPDTIRHYERMGLLKAPKRSAAGYRDYPLGATDRLRLIRRALGAGFSLRELAEILRIRDSGRIPCRSVRDAAGKKLVELDRQIRDLKTARQQLRLILRDWDARLASTKRGQPAKLLENLPKEMEEQAHAIHQGSGRRSLARQHGIRSAATE
jgi:MerR family transcriptional regulator, copper efflux regulator